MPSSEPLASVIWRLTEARSRRVSLMVLFISDTALGAPLRAQSVTERSLETSSERPPTLSSRLMVLA